MEPGVVESVDDNDVSLPAVSLCEDPGLLFLYLTGGLTVGVPVCKPISSTAGEPHREPPCSLHSWKAMQGTVIRWLTSSLTNERYCQTDWCPERANKISSIRPRLSCYISFKSTRTCCNTGWRCWSDQKEAGAATNYGKKLAGIHCNPLKYNQNSGKKMEEKSSGAQKRHKRLSLKGVLNVFFSSWRKMSEGKEEKASQVQPTQSQRSLVSSSSLFTDHCRPTHLPN